MESSVSFFAQDFCLCNYYISLSFFVSPMSSVCAQASYADFSLLFLLWSFFLFKWQAKLAVKLPHVQSLCVHEMVVWAFKHVLQAVVASCKNAAGLPLNIAAALNVMLSASLLE